MSQNENVSLPITTNNVSQNQSKSTNSNSSDDDDDDDEEEENDSNGENENNDKSSEDDVQQDCVTSTKSSFDVSSIVSFLLKLSNQLNRNIGGR